MSFDFNKFHSVLFNECKRIFFIILEELSHENIYSLALYNSGDNWGYLFPTVATKKGLSEVAAEYQKDEYYQNQSMDELEADLKWSPCDSPRHVNYESTLKESEKLLQQAEDMMEEYWDNHQEDKCDELHQQLVQTCLDVLKRLDSEGIFQAIDRTSFVLNVLNGDQSDEERLERAKLLNPEQVFKQYELEI
ncbi:MAG: DUF4303 domain-containing protein [Desulfobacteraceae bacterium]|nr:DUF4303 domain-containing protein [Desulfobacteraceae bacterium]